MGEDATEAEKERPRRCATEERSSAGQSFWGHEAARKLRQESDLLRTSFWTVTVCTACTLMHLPANALLAPVLPTVYMVFLFNVFIYSTYLKATNKALFRSSVPYGSSSPQVSWLDQVAVIA